MTKKYKPMQNEKEKNEQEKKKDEPAIKSDPGTTHTTDPQEHMKGPISSLMHDIGETFPDEDVDKSDNR